MNWEDFSALGHPLLPMTNFRVPSLSDLVQDSFQHSNDYSGAHRYISAGSEGGGAYRECLWHENFLISAQTEGKLMAFNLYSPFQRQSTQIQSKALINKILPWNNNIVVAADDSSLSLFPVTESSFFGREVNLQLHESFVTGLDVFDNYLASCSLDMHVCLTHFSTMRKIMHFNVHRSVNSVCFGNEPHLLFTVSSDQVNNQLIHSWDLRNSSTFCSEQVLSGALFENHNTQQRHAVCHHGESWSTNHDTYPTVYHKLVAEQQRGSALHRPPSWGCQQAEETVEPAYHFEAAPFSRRPQKRFDADTNSEYDEFSHHSPDVAILSIQKSPCGTFLLTSASDGTHKLWRENCFNSNKMEGWATLAQPRGSHARCAARFLDNDHIVAGGSNGVLYMWKIPLHSKSSIQTPFTLSRLFVEYDAILALSVENGQILASCSHKLGIFSRDEQVLLEKPFYDTTKNRKRKRSTSSRCASVNQHSKHESPPQWSETASPFSCFAQSMNSRTPQITNRSIMDTSIYSEGALAEVIHNFNQSPTFVNAFSHHELSDSSSAMLDISPIAKNRSVTASPVTLLKSQSHHAQSSRSSFQTPLLRSRNHSSPFHRTPLRSLYVNIPQESASVTLRKRALTTSNHSGGAENAPPHTTNSPRCSRTRNHTTKQVSSLSTHQGAATMNKAQPSSDGHEMPDAPEMAHNTPLQRRTTRRRRKCTKKQEPKSRESNVFVLEDTPEQPKSVHTNVINLVDISSSSETEEDSVILVSYRAP